MLSSLTLFKSFFRKKELSNLIIRGLTVISRFFLIFFISKEYSVEDVGLYGLFYTSTSLGILLLGLDFYNYSNRELLYVTQKEKINILKNQAIFHLLSYSILLFPFVLLFSFGALPWKYILIFYCILISDHISQELYRIFTILSKPIFANILLFFRNGIWVYILITYLLLKNQGEYSLSTIFTFWLVGSLSSVLIGVYKLVKDFGYRSFFKVDFSWIRKGIRISALYFASTISLIGIDHINRYIIQFSSGLKDVGVFTFYTQFTNVINVFVFTLVIMITYPDLIHHHKNKNTIAFKKVSTNMTKRVILLSVSVGIILGIGIFPILNFVGQEAYKASLPSFYILIGANIMLNMSYIFHYVLYAQNKDKHILTATLISSVISITLNLLLIPMFGLPGAAIALLVSYTSMFLLKWRFSHF